MLLWILGGPAKANAGYSLWLHSAYEPAALTELAVETEKTGTAEHTQAVDKTVGDTEDESVEVKLTMEP